MIRKRKRAGKILASFLILTLLFSSVSVAAQKDTGVIDAQQEQAAEEVSGTDLPPENISEEMPESEASAGGDVLPEEIPSGEETPDGENLLPEEMSEQGDVSSGEDVPEGDTLPEGDAPSGEASEETAVEDVPSEEAALPEYPPEEEKVSSEELPKEEDFDGLMTPEELKELDDTTAGSTMWKSGFSLFRMIKKEDWSFDTYYVNQEDDHHVDKNQDFSLKYQMEFHTSLNFPEGTVEIRIPSALFAYRNSEPALPDDVAVPQAYPDHPVPSRSTPFDYYIDDETGELVFFNYKEIRAGSNAAWQVLYKGLKIMEITDGTEWSLTPKISITIQPTEEGKEAVTQTDTLEPLTGRTDSSVTLSSISKTPYSAPGKRYTPGLYTEDQVKSYIQGPLPEKYAGENFKKYRFTVWDVKIKGSGTQPWNLLLRDRSFIEGKTDSPGEVAGWRNNTSTGYPLSLDTGQNLSSEFTVLKSACKESSWGSRFYVVTAYPADQVAPDTILNNEIEVRLEPFDQKDPVQTRSDAARWSYADYDWVYPPGNRIGVTKGRDEQYTGWLEVYRQASAKGEDYGAFPFSTTGTFRGYDLTHTVVSSKDSVIGEYKKGDSYSLTTVDDFMYVYPSGEGGRMLDGRDYYFSGVTVTQTDTGYDVWEDKECGPEPAEGIDQSLKIYAMFEGDTDWVLADTVPWKDTGVMHCEFGKELTDKKPWRVKAVHETVNYRTVCKIDVKVCIRHDLPVMKEILKGSSGKAPDSVRFENLSGIVGAQYHEGEFVRYWHSQSEENGNYGEPGLKDATKALYEVLLERDNAFKTATGLLKEAASFKTSKSSNDVQGSRVQTEYCLTAYDGYEIFGREGMEYLKNADIQSPGRKEVAFYDLLPYGMRFDPSVPVTAGRITSLSSGFKDRPGSWDTSQVTVLVDSGKDIVENYENTGRTMVVFHIRYAGADAAVYTNERWIEGWGLHFSAYYDWKDLNVVQKGANISAFMPEDAQDAPLYQEPLFGTEQEVACDDGVIVPSGFEEDYKYFGKDINRDGITHIRNVLYARNVAVEDVALAAESKVQKLVRADADRFGVYAPSAVVEAGEGYTYDITVSNAERSGLKNIVVYDRLEQASEDRKENNTDPFWPFKEDIWHGTFQSVVTSGLEEMGIAPKVYYNVSRDARITEGRQLPSDILTAENGWYPAEEFEVKTGRSTDQVKAVALDLGRAKDGGEFVLASMDSVTFQIRMKAPEKISPSACAYNNPSFYSFHEESDTEYTVEGDAVRVLSGGMGTLEILKEFKGEIPGAVRDTSFEFVVSRRDEKGFSAFANQEYQLWKKEDDGWVCHEERLYATDGHGCLSLLAGEKAVFVNLPDVEHIQVEEVENPFWKSEAEDTAEMTDGLMVRKVKAVNSYRPILYVQKKIQGVPKGKDVSSETFTFCLQSDGEALANAEFWYVDSIRTDGGVPAKVTGLGDRGIGHTDKDGMFTIRQGQIIALFPGLVGTRCVLTEILKPKDASDWICQSASWEGTLSVRGTQAAITNCYRWKDLYLKKEITHQDVKDCKEEFTFRIEKVGDKNEPLTGNPWVLLDENGQETDRKGVLGTDGMFTCACGGKIVRIGGLEAGEHYVVTETDSGALYRPVSDIEELTMPVYAGTKQISMTNDYLKRPLLVTKTVVCDRTDPAQVKEAEQSTFTMTITMNGIPLKEYPYIITQKDGVILPEAYTDSQGNFSLKDGQTATFKEAGILGDVFEVTEKPDKAYPQIYPANGASHRGTLQGEGGSVTFVNGKDGGLLIGKEYTGGDQAGALYVEKIKQTPEILKDMSVTLTLEIRKKGSIALWPPKDTPVDIIDSADGQITTKKWPKEASMTIEPWKTIIIPKGSIPEDAEYLLSESEEDRHRIVEWPEGQWLKISQNVPADDEKLTGNVLENPMAIIRNEITGIPFTGSVIEKRMTVDSQEVHKDAQLVWRLEQYNGNSWNPAAGVGYVVFDDAGAVSSQVMVTGEDGKILLYKTGYGYPYVRFINASVRLNLYQGMKRGDLRLTEVPEDSDAAWGMLVGYGREGGAKDAGESDYSMSLEPDLARAFVNGTRMTEIEVEKKMQSMWDETFTFYLKQVLSVSEDTVTSSEQILASDARQGIAYTVCDSATGLALEDRVTGKGGKFRLRAGQYARFLVPDKTRWIVSEEIKPTFTLKNLTGSPGDRLVRLSDDQMLICPKAEVIPLKLIVETLRAGAAEKELLKKEDFKVRILYSDGRIRTVENEFTFEPAQMPESGNTADITIFCEGLKAKTVLKVIRTISLTSLMVSRGVVDADTNEPVVLNKGNVRIPENILWQDTMYRVTGIEPSAFENRIVLTGVEMPPSVTYMGESAFARCPDLKNVMLSPNLTELPARAFYKCSSLEKVEIPSKVTSIGVAAFADCGLLEVDVPEGVKTMGSSVFTRCRSMKRATLPSTLELIPEWAFQNCNSLEHITIPKGITAIDSYAFQLCSVLKDVILPEGIVRVGSYAFQSCELLESMIIPEGVTEIGRQAFSQCYSLLNVEIPSTTESIGYYTFYECGSLTEVLIHREKDSIPNAPWSANYKVIIWAGSQS